MYNRYIHYHTTYCPAMSNRKRIRAHANPLCDVDIYVPLTPLHMNWSSLYPNMNNIIKNNNDNHSTADITSISTTSTATSRFHPTIADIGCGFGGLTVSLSTALPDKYIIAVEIRDKVVDIVRKRIIDLQSTGTPQYNNIAVIECNFMKHMNSYFMKSSLEKLFFCFPDPHFKRSNYRRRIINTSFLDYYTYILQLDGLLYFITDVYDLYVWMCEHCDIHPLLMRITDNEWLDNDKCYQLIYNDTEEGQKVTRIHGNKYSAVYRRIHNQH